jgi:hypothetical protein
MSNTWVSLLAGPIILTAACEDGAGPAAVEVPNPFIAALEVEAPPNRIVSKAGSPFDIILTIHNPTQILVQLDSPRECLLTSVEVVVPFEEDPRLVPLIGTGDIPCPGVGATLLHPGGTIVITHRLVGWFLDDSVEARWRHAPWPGTHVVRLNLEPLERTVEAQVYFQWSGHHWGFGRDCDPSSTPPDTIRVTVNPQISFNEALGTQVQYEIHDTRPNTTGITVCQPLISAAVDQLADSGWVHGSGPRFCLQHWSGRYEIGSGGCMRGVKYLDENAEGTYRLRIGTWHEVLVSDSFVVNPDSRRIVP